MKEQELLGHLLDLARRMDFEVRTDQGPFRDGSCRLAAADGHAPESGDTPDRRLILLNRNSPAHRKISALGRALSGISLEGVFLLPAVRDAIQRGSGNDPVEPNTDTDELPTETA
jgi:hypothetical protein